MQDNQAPKPFLVLSIIVSGDGWVRAELIDWQTNAYCDTDRHDIPGLQIETSTAMYTQPHDAARNKVIEYAQAKGARLLFCLDDDMRPPKEFFDATLARMWANIQNGGEPIVIAAPYCTGGPKEIPNVFRYRTEGNNIHNLGTFLNRYTREEAAYETGLTEVPNIGPGTICYDMRAFDMIKQPYYEFIYADQAHTIHARSEDVHCHWQMREAGVRIYCDWDHWASHRKESWILQPTRLCEQDMIDIRAGHIRAIQESANGVAAVAGASAAKAEPRTCTTFPFTFPSRGPEEIKSAGAADQAPVEFPFVEYHDDKSTGETTNKSLVDDLVGLTTPSAVIVNAAAASAPVPGTVPSKASVVDAWKRSIGKMASEIESAYMTSASTIPKPAAAVPAQFDPASVNLWEPSVGWCGRAMREVYADAVHDAKDGDTFVEVGAFVGLSSIVMAREIAKSGKRIKFIVVDHFRGSPGETEHAAYLKTHDLKTEFDRNIAHAGVAGTIDVMVMPSLMAATAFDNGSLQFVFIDASHKYDDVCADIAAWLPLVNIGGALAGHDYHDSWPSVRRAVDESGGPRHEVHGDCWIKRINGPPLEDKSLLSIIANIVNNCPYDGKIAMFGVSGHSQEVQAIIATSGKNLSVLHAPSSLFQISPGVIYDASFVASSLIWRLDQFNAATSPHGIICGDGFDLDNVRERVHFTFGNRAMKVGQNWYMQKG
jgi:hypothetical protein